jgi:hypothetical protein
LFYFLSATTKLKEEQEGDDGDEFKKNDFDFCRKTKF